MKGASRPAGRTKGELARHGPSQASTGSTWPRRSQRAKVCLAGVRSAGWTCWSSKMHRAADRAGAAEQERAREAGPPRLRRFRLRRELVADFPADPRASVSPPRLLLLNRPSPSARPIKLSTGEEAQTWKGAAGPTQTSTGTFMLLHDIPTPTQFPARRHPKPPTCAPLGWLWSNDHATAPVQPATSLGLPETLIEQVDVSFR
jgi:hypothetical protein